MSNTENPKYFKDIFDISKYDMNKIRTCGVTAEGINKWIKTFEYFNISTDIDINLYAIEFAYRVSNKYGTRKLPNVNGNIFSQYPYYFICPPFGDSNPPKEGWSTKEKEKASEEMLRYLIKTIKPETLNKWKI